MVASSVPSAPNPISGLPNLTVADWQRAVVYGLGGSGIAATQLLLERGVSVVAVDDRSQLDLPPELTQDKRFTVQPQDRVASDLDEFDGVVVSPGVPADRPLLEAAAAAGISVLGELELAYQVLVSGADGVRAPLCAITGSNGKSTVTQMTADLLSPLPAVPCGNFGLPLSECVRGQRLALEDSAADWLPILVAEVSSFQLETVQQFHPRVAAFLNLSADHLDRHGSLESYVDAKRRVFARQVAGDIAVLNADDPIVVATELPAGVRRREFSLEGPVSDGCYLDHHRVLLVEPSQEPVVIFERSDLVVVGDHNLANAMAAVLLALAIGADRRSVPERLRGFAGLPHRTQLVARQAGVAWFDDSKGTNIGATLRSLAGFNDHSVLLIAGGRSKGSDFTELAGAVRRKVSHLYLVGEAADQLQSDLNGAAPSTIAGTIDTAVRLARDAARPGQVVLLSPACASFDQFTSYVERGQFFQREVLAALGTPSNFTPTGGEHG